MAVGAACGFREQERRAIGCGDSHQGRREQHFGLLSVQKRLVLVCEGSLCPRKQPDVSGPGLGEARCYRGRGPSWALLP